MGISRISGGLLQLASSWTGAELWGCIGLCSALFLLVAVACFSFCFTVYAWSFCLHNAVALLLVSNGKHGPLPLAFFISVRWSHNSDALRQQAFRFLLLYWRAWGGPLPTSFHNTALCFLSAIMICIILGSPRKGLSTNMFTIGSDVRFRVDAARILFDFQFGLQVKTAWVLNWLCRVVSICFYCCVMLSNPTMKHRH